jgi:hypothetical protein
MKKDKAQCFWCGKPRFRWAIKLADGKKTGEYCTKKCAELDMYGPIFRGAEAVKK